MEKQIYRVATELSLMGFYWLHQLYPDILFEVDPLDRRTPLLFDYFDTKNVSKEVENALWDILEILNPIIKNGDSDDLIEKLLPAGFTLPGTLEMSYDTALHLLNNVEGNSWLLPSSTMTKILEDSIDYVNQSIK